LESANREARNRLYRQERERKVAIAGMLREYVLDWFAFKDRSAVVDLKGEAFL